MAAAVPLPLAFLEAAVPLAELESELESDFVVLDATSDVFVGDSLEDAEDVEDVEDVTAREVNCQTRCPARQDHGNLTTLWIVLPPYNQAF